MLLSLRNCKYLCFCKEIRKTYWARAVGTVWLRLFLAILYKYPRAPVLLLCYGVTIGVVVLDRSRKTILTETKHTYYFRDPLARAPAFGLPSQQDEAFKRKMETLIHSNAFIFPSSQVCPQIH